MAEATDVQVAIEGEFIERGATPIHATITDDGWLMRARSPDRPTLTSYRESCQEPVSRSFSNGCTNQQTPMATRISPSLV